MDASGDQACNVGHIDHEPRPDSISDRSEASEVDDSRIGGGASNYELRPLSTSDSLNLIVVQHLGIPAYSVVREAIELEQLNA